MSNMHFLPKSLFKYLCVDDDYLEKENWLYFIIAYDLLSSIDWPSFRILYNPVAIQFPICHRI
jgi:hypothetical protein